MRLLVTGHKGYIGTTIVPLFIAAGHQVTGLDNGLFEDCGCGELPPEVPGIRKDLRDVEAADLEGFDAIVHLGGLSSDPLGDLNRAATEEINLTAGIRLARLAKEAGVRRFLLSSSCAVYGSAGAEMVDETGRLDPLTTYARAKLDLERGLSRLSDSTFTTTYLRNGVAYGFSPRLRLDLVLNDFVAAAYVTGRIHIRSDGMPWRPMVHIEDIGRAFLAVLHASADTVQDQAFNIGTNEENRQVRELAEVVRDTVTGCTIEYAAGAGPDRRCFRVDCGKIRRMLPDFQPQWNTSLGARQIYDAFRLRGLTREDRSGRRYNRLATVQWLIERGVLDGSLRRTDPPRAGNYREFDGTALRISQ